MVGPLAGCTVGITGDRRWSEQADLLERRGARVVHGPVMETGSMDDSEATRRATEATVAAAVDHAVLTTGIGTRSWFAVAESAGLDDALRASLASATVLARGPKARSAALANGLDVHWSAASETSAELLRELQDRGVAGRRVVVQRDGGDPVLARALAELGAEVLDVPVYRWQVPDDTQPAERLLEAATEGRLHALTFTCAYAVRSAFALAPEPEALAAALNEAVRPVAVGPVTAAALRDHGVDGVVEPRRARLGAMVQALVTDLASRHRRIAFGGATVRWQGHLLLHPDGTDALLTPREAELLTTLVARAPGVVPKAALTGDGAGLHAAEAAVARLRGKLGPLATAIRTVPRRGYACDLEVLSDDICGG